MFTENFSIHGLVLPWSGFVSVAALLAEVGNGLAVAVALPSLREWFWLTSCCTDSERVITSDLAGDCADCGYH